jgi:hypothetical protein
MFNFLEVEPDDEEFTLDTGQEQLEVCEAVIEGGEGANDYGIFEAHCVDFLRALKRSSRL